MTKKLFIKTYGCQMNVYDSDRMTRLLAHHGYSSVDTANQADLVLLNTCHIREKAAEKVYSELGRLRQMRDEKAQTTGKDTLLAVAGCVAQAEGEAMVDRAPFVDIVVGPQTYHRLPELLAKRERSRGAVLDIDFPIESKFDELPTDAPLGNGVSPNVSAFLTVQEGCDKFCTFCVVPYTRGSEESRSVESLLAEAKALARGGTREVTLLGQNVNAYHGVGADGRSQSLAELICRIAEIDGIERIRYTTSHPADMSDDLIRAHGEVPALMPFLHLPVQSGSNSILKAMNRKYTVEAYKDIIGRLRQARPDLALSSDFIVGFPGETDEDFEATMRLVEDIEFQQAFSFKYSPRPGTPGAAMPRQIKASIGSERLTRLQALLTDQSQRFNAGLVGCTTSVLLEREGRHEDQLVGRTPYMQAVHLKAQNNRIGDLVDVKILANNAHSLTGRCVGKLDRMELNA